MEGSVAQDIETRFAGLVADVRNAVDANLATGLAGYPDTPVRAVAEYVVSSGGHRWRAIAATAAGLIFRPDALEVGLPGACGVELAHAASMVLDDLPSMDDARYRRGQLCAHHVFPAWAVDMAPVFMLTMAYDISLANERATPERRVDAALRLSRAGQSMIAGQVSDLANADDDEAQLLARYRLKTGWLYAAATSSGGVLCGATAEEAAVLEEAGHNLGLASQFLDDVYDVDATLEEVGKEPGSDSHKVTAIDLYGVDGTRRRMLEFQERAEEDLTIFGPGADLLRHLIRTTGA